MLTSTYANFKYNFYPLGNTPAVDLLRDTAPDQDGAIKILLLGCGDIGNILFTLANQDHDILATRFDFTACDFEPAVLARNLLLVTFVTANASKFTAVDESILASLWSQYYHFFLSKTELATLQEHAQTLARYATSDESWEASPFADTVIFLSQSTRQNVGRFWSLYAQDRDLSRSGVFGRDFVEQVHQTIKLAKDTTSTSDITGSRMAGIRASDADAAVKQAFKRYWEVGAAPGASHGSQQRGFVNPLFAFSTSPKGKGGHTGEFAVHRATHYLSGFHLPHAINPHSSRNAQVSSLTKHAQAEFANWCSSLCKATNQGRFKLRVHCSEAVAFAHALQNSMINNPVLPRAAHVYNMPFSATSMEIDQGKLGTCDRLFDVIDTSNIVDTVGVLRILPAVVPLLARTEAAVFYVESFFIDSDSPDRLLQDMLVADPVAVFAILGVVPTEYQAGLSCDTIMAHQRMLNNHTGQTRCRISWRHSKFAVDGGRPRVDASDLANVFHKWYVAMFGGRRHPPKANYSRLSFVALLALVKIKSKTNWNEFVDQLCTAINSDHDIDLGSNYINECAVQMHLNDIKSLTDMTRRIRFEMQVSGCLRFSRGEAGLIGSPSLPDMVHATLVVPRAQLYPFTSGSLLEVGSPIFQFLVMNEGLFAKIFSAIDACFGRLIYNGSSHEAEIEENPDGWNGNADLIVTCAVPSYLFQLGERAYIVGALAVAKSYGAPMHMLRLVRHFGKHMIVFRASLDNRQNLFLLRTPPRLKGHPLRSSNTQTAYRPCRDTSFSPNRAVQSKLDLDVDGVLQGVQVTGAFAAKPDKDLSKSSLPIIVRQSPSVFHASFAGETCTLPFGVPVGKAQTSTKIVNRVFHAEMSASPASVTGSKTLASHTFGLLRSGPSASDILPNCFGRLNLDRQPCLVYSHSSRALNASLAQSLAAVHSAAATPMPHEFLKLCESFNHVIKTFHAARAKSKGSSHMAFVIRQGEVLDGLLVATEIRHDLHGGGVVLDGFFIPGCPSLASLLESEKASHVLLSPPGCVLFKRLLPTVVERARYTWTHTKACAYNAPEATVPLSTAAGSMAICDCGAGQFDCGFPKSLAKVKHLATRLALSPIFPPFFGLGEMVRSRIPSPAGFEPMDPLHLEFAMRMLTLLAGGFGGAAPF